jgi:hypothetical protein
MILSVYFSLLQSICVYVDRQCSIIHTPILCTSMTHPFIKAASFEPTIKSVTSPMAVPHFTCVGIWMVCIDEMPMMLIRRTLRMRIMKRSCLSSTRISIVASALTFKTQRDEVVKEMGEGSNSRHHSNAAAGVEIRGRPVV